MNPSEVAKRNSEYRDELVSKIEAHTGSLTSIPWDKVSTEDMQKLLSSLEGK